MNQPSRADMDALIAFLPEFSQPGFEPMNAQLESDAQLEAFMRLASQDLWMDHAYDPAETSALLEHPALVATASLEQVRSMLTFIVRGERFSDGHWAAMVRGGHVQRVLARLEQLKWDRP